MTWPPSGERSAHHQLQNPPHGHTRAHMCKHPCVACLHAAQHLSENGSCRQSLSVLTFYHTIVQNLQVCRGGLRPLLAGEQGGGAARSHEQGGTAGLQLSRRWVVTAVGQGACFSLTCQPLAWVWKQPGQTRGTPYCKSIHTTLLLVVFGAEPLGGNICNPNEQQPITAILCRTPTAMTPTAWRKSMGPRCCASTASS